MKEVSADQLVQYRTKNHLSQQEMADIIGVSQRSYSSWELNQSKPKAGSLIKILELLEVKSSKDVTHLSNNHQFGIPLIPIDAMAGVGVNTGIQITSENIELTYLVPDFKGADFMIRVKGDSMYPRYNSGDIVACKKLNIRDVFFQWNKVYVLDTDQGAILKRVSKASDQDKIMAVSDNESYAPFELKLSQIHGIAIVVGVIRPE